MPGRRLARLLALAFLAMSVIIVPQNPAAAAVAGDNGCDVKEWVADPDGCAARLADVSAARASCLEAPPPDSPEDGLGGWFASRPDADKVSGQRGFYTEFGYAGYAYTTYDIGCQQTLMHPDYKFENTVANGEFLVSIAVLGASDSLRERAWEPAKMWGWADPLVSQATRAVFRQVFTPFGAITLAIVGLYLLWRSRQAHMSSAMTTAGWALLVMVVVTAVASWPTFSAHTADKAMVGSLTTVHNALAPPPSTIPAAECARRKVPDSCRDLRPPAIRASDTVVPAMLYRNWLRGLLGSADSATAAKYGPALYRARTLSWAEAADLNRDPGLRSAVVAKKATQWEKVAEQIRTEDPAAYEYLTGVRGLERIGAGLIALVSSVMFALFDFTASVLVLLGFVVFRWAIVATPLIGTVGLLRPASAGLRRLVNAVVASVFNIVIFGSGAAVYLFAVGLIMSTNSIPGWLQVVLIGLCGVVGWTLLRPYRRITQLTGGASVTATALATRQRESTRAVTHAIAGAPPAGSRPAAPLRVEARPEMPPGIRAQSPPIPPPGPRPMPVPSVVGASQPSTGVEAPSELYRPRPSPDRVLAATAGSRERAEAQRVP